MDFYNRGGATGIEIGLPNQTISLTTKFISRGTASRNFIPERPETTALTQIPKMLPRIDDDRLAKRKVGAEYWSH